VTKTQKILKHSVAGTLLVITIVGLILGTSLASAQITSGAFKPQAKFPAGSSFSITSVYGIAIVPSHNQSKGSHPSHQSIQADQAGSEVSSTSIIVNGQVANYTRNGGVQWTIKSGTIVIPKNTLTITGGTGTIDSADRLLIVGTATDSSGHKVKWQFTGLAANYEGTLIAELNGSFNEPNNSGSRGNTFDEVTLTCIATVS